MNVAYDHICHKSPNVAKEIYQTDIFQANKKVVTSKISTKDIIVLYILLLF